MGYAAMKIRRGDTYEYESSRVTHRIRTTREILSVLGCDFTLHPAGHTENCPRHPEKLSRVMHHAREQVICNCEFRNARPELPAWLTDEMINKAWSLADQAIEARGRQARAMV